MIDGCPATRPETVEPCDHMHYEFNLVLADPRTRAECIARRLVV